jgi:hypothetical protein
LCAGTRHAKLLARIVGRPRHFRLADHDPAERFGLSTDIADVQPILTEGVARMEESQEFWHGHGQWAVLGRTDGAPSKAAPIPNPV